MPTNKITVEMLEKSVKSIDEIIEMQNKFSKKIGELEALKKLLNGHIREQKKQNGHWTGDSEYNPKKKRFDVNYKKY